jgi:hypothetical protein
VDTAQFGFRGKYQAGTRNIAAFISKLGTEIKLFEPVVSIKLSECLDAVECRLRERKNFRNSIALLARLGGNPLTKEVSFHSVEQFVLHAILLGPLSFINLKKQDPPRAALKAGEVFARRYADASNEKNYEESVMVNKIAEDLLVAVQADDDLARATCGWILMALIQALQPDWLISDNDEMEGSSALWDVSEDVEHCSRNEECASDRIGAAPRLGAAGWSDEAEARPTLQQAALALAAHIINGPFQGSVEHASFCIFSQVSECVRNLCNFDNISDNFEP